MNIEYLKSLLSTASISGYEENAAASFAELAKSCGATVETDELNNTYAFFGPSDAAQTLMVDAHIDEIGMQVSYIDPDGYLYFRKDGGIDAICVPGSVVEIRLRDGKVIPGVIGKRPIHLLTPEERKQAIELDCMWIDTGMEADEVKKLVNVGDPVNFRANFNLLGTDRVSSKGLDDKIGVFVITEVMRRIAGKSLSKKVCLVAASQEEVGCRGARIAGEFIKPDWSVSIDVDFATDVPDCPKTKFGDITLGKGVVITRHLDSNRKFSDLAVDIARKKGIPHQISAHIAPTGGTDAAVIQMTGPNVKTLLLGIPNRYMHTPVEVVDLRDVEAAVDLVEQICLL